MDSDRFEQVGDLFETLRQCPPKERAAALDRSRVDTDVRREVEKLLHHHDRPTSFLEEPRLEERVKLTPSLFGVDADGSEEAATLPDHIGRFRILGLCGQGGMGTVYLAEQDHPRRRVALKMMRAEHSSPRLLRRFEQEAAVLARLQHPGIAHVYEAGTVPTELGDRPYFAMELVEGLPLLEFANEHALDARQRLRLFVTICDAVHHAHEKGVIHRDLKPDNVLVTRPSSTDEIGQPKILDFGIARAIAPDLRLTTLQTDPHRIVGTLPYMSPEQLNGDSERLTARSDVYALGVLLYELLTGRLPILIDDRPLPEASRMVRNEPATPLGSVDPSLRGDVETIVHHCLEKDPARRYVSAAALAGDLRRYLHAQPITARPPSTFYQLSQFARRHKALVGGIVAVLITLAAGVAVSTFLAVKADRNARLAQRNERRAEASSAAASRHAAEALENERLANRAAYRANILAASALLEVEPLSAWQRLEDCPEHLRGWEWHHLRSLLDPRIEIVAPPVSDDLFLPSCSAYRPDGTGLHARSANGSTTVTDLASGNVILSIPTPPGVNVLRFVDGGRRLIGAAVGSEGCGSIWDLTSGRQLQDDTYGESARGGRAESGFTISEDGRRVGRRRGGSVEVLDLESGERVARLDATGSNGKVALSADGQRLAVTSTVDRVHSVTVVDLDGQVDPRESRSATLPRRGPAAPVFSPDRSLLACPSEPDIVLLDVETLESVAVLHGSLLPSLHLAFSSDGRHFASVTWTELLIWDIATRRVEAVYTIDTERRFVTNESPHPRVAFSPDGRDVLVVSSRRARIWPASPSDHRVMVDRGSPVRVAMAISREGSWLATLRHDQDGDNVVELRDAVTGEVVHEWSLPFRPRALAFSDDDLELLAFDRRHWIAWDLMSTATASDPIPIVLQHHRWKPVLRQLPRRFLSGARGTFGGTEYEVASPDGSFHYVGLPNHLEVFDLARQAQVTTPLADGVGFASYPKTARRDNPFPDNGVCVAVHPGRRFVATGHALGTIRIWACPSGEEVAALTGHEDAVRTLTFSPDGQRLVSGGDDRVLRVWETDTFETVLELRGHESTITSARFSPDGTRLLSSATDGTVRVWDSLSPSTRQARLVESEARRGEARPRVDALFNEHGDPTQVAEQIRSRFQSPALAAAQRAFWERSK